MRRSIDIDALYDKVLESRAERLGVTKERAAQIPNQKPLFILAAEKRAKEEGKTVEEILQGYSRQMAESHYPTPDCLTPGEVEDYAQSGTLPASRLEHLNNCNACDALLGATTPPPERIEEFAAEVRQLVSNIPVQASAVSKAAVATAEAVPVGRGVPSRFASVASFFSRRHGPGK